VFVPDPIGPIPGQRLYATGDVARYLPDGTLEFIGREDDQVKVRGCRVELGEVEAALREHPNVRAAVAVAPADATGTRHIVAYVVPQTANRRFSVGELRQHLEQRLSDFALPSSFVFLPALPLAPSGKVNRRALPAPSAARPELGHEFCAPSTELERQLAAIWRELLRIEDVGVHDRFFDLGGHSLLAVQVHRRLRELLPERPVGITDLFRFPTVAALAEFLGGADAGDARLQDGAARGEARRSALQRRPRRAGGEGA